MTVTIRSMGGAGDDILVGEDGDDVITGGAGDDTIDGSADNDIAIFAGNRLRLSLQLTA